MSELDTFIEQLKDRLPIETVVQQKVQLDRRGQRYWGLCPFHAEKSPSFTVLPAGGFYKCFGCGVGGDIITFIRETEGREFMDALQILADMAGMEVPRGSRGKSKTPQEREMQELAREAMQISRRFMIDALASPDGAPARESLRGRGVKSETAIEFGLGWAPRDRQALIAEFARKRIPAEALDLTGLVLKDEQSGRLKARFWERLMFPVADAAGRTAGFGGRYLPGSFAEEKGLGKYVNSPDGPLFPKRRLLYGMERLQRACRDQKDAPVVVCEGNLDVVLLQQAGFLTTVASLGTSLSEEHARWLKRFDRTVVMLMDADPAGRRASARAARLLVAEGVDVRVAELPEGADPADMVQSGQSEELRRRLENAWDILKWRLDTWSRKKDLSIPAVLDQAATEMAEWIRSTPRPVVAEVWAQRTVEALPGVTSEALRRLVQGSGGTAPQSKQVSAGSTHQPEQLSPEQVLRSNERQIVAAILRDPSALSRFRSEVETLELSDSPAGETLAWCLARRAAGEFFDLESCLLAFPEGETASWLDRVRQLQIEQPSLVLERALEVLPANREQARLPQAGDEPTEDDLRSYMRSVSISPQQEAS